jgi:hypothetical protein
MTKGTDKTKNTLVQRIFDFFLVYRVFQKLCPRKNEETRDRIWICNFEEKKI